MKLAISARGDNPEAGVDQSFGRAYWFLVLDVESGKWSTVDNAQNRNASENSGVLAARALAEVKVTVLLTGETGPKAFRALQAAGIEVYHGASGTVEEVVLSWREGRMKKARLANSQGSPSCLMASVPSPNASPQYPKVAVGYQY